MKTKRIDYLKKKYPVGSRVELLQMEDDQAPPIGMGGTVYGVDDIGSILVGWDNGSSLNVIDGVDQVVIIKKDSFEGCKNYSETKK